MGGGFQRGEFSPLWHTTLLARCSVLYLLARLTGEAGCGAFAPRLHRQENGRGFCERERTKSLSVFGERRQVYKPPVPRPPCQNVHRNEVRFRRFLAGGTPPPAPKIKGGGQAPLVLARLTHQRANQGGAVKVGAESAMHFNLDGSGWVCYLFRSLEFVLSQGFGCFSVVQHYNRKRQYLPNHDSYNLHTVRFTI